MSLQLLIDQQLGIHTRRVDSDPSLQIGLVATKLLEHNPNRVSYIIINLGSNDAYIAFDENVSTNRGILLTAHGGFLNVIWRDDLTLPSDALYGITTAAADAVFISSQVADTLQNIGVK